MTRKHFLIACFIQLTGMQLWAIEPQETLLLWKGAAPGALGTAEKDRPKLMVYLPAKAAANGSGIVVCPGGGYGGLAMGHEGREIAEWLNGMGAAACVLDYRHRGKGYGHPAPMLDVQRAIRQVRANADQWHLDTKRIGVLGFSAGGHLASTAGTHFDRGLAEAEDPVDRMSCRPDFMVLCYPVIAFDEPYTHRGSQKNLLGENASDELVRQFSNEKQVNEDTPPTFMFHTDADYAVPAENSTAFYAALRQAKVTAELHIYANGGHGVGLARDIQGTSTWSQRCEEWMSASGFLGKQ
ncbi:MAG: alpha/beta hydrolase [Pirellulales bacterium]|nr:alpha/beta hydrolase [Pirellulales bacterium]